MTFKAYTTAVMNKLT